MPALTSDLIYGFTGSVLSSSFDEPAPTPDCHREWWELCCSEHKRVAISAPRGHAKSTAITKAYVLAAILFRDRQHVVIVSDTYKQATTFLGEIKRELSTNDQLKGLFGVPEEFETDREDEIVVKLHDGHEFRIVAMGSEQKVRGIIWNNKRPDLIVGDDLENDEIVMNPDRREKFQKWLFNALLPAMSHRGIVRLVGTILHMASALELLMPRDKDPNTIHEPLRKIMKEPVGGWMSVRYDAHTDDFSKVLWPGKWSKEKLQEVQAMFVSRGNPEGYYQEYRNRPIDPSHTFFKKGDFLDFSKYDYESRVWDYSPTYLSFDGAWTTKEKRDWCAFAVGSVDDQGMLYIRHVIRERMDPKEVCDTIAKLQQVYKFTTCLMGKGAYEKGIGPFLQDEVRRYGRFLHVEGIPEVIDKRLRAQSIRGRMRAGGVKINKSALWYPDFEQEMLEFDRGQHDDQVDIMSLFGLYLDQLGTAPSVGQIKEMEYEDDVERFGSFELSGRSLLTGY